MRVKVECCCGSSFEIEDKDDRYINFPEGDPDEEGRKYSWELKVDNWLQMHESCRKRCRKETKDETTS